MRDLRIRIINKYGGKCACKGCGICDFEFLTIDHIKGNGGSEVGKGLRFNTVTAFYRYLDSEEPNLKDYQVLCSGCNFAKSDKDRCPLYGTYHPRRKRS